MKRFPIFRTGKHTASSGVALDFTDAQLRAAVAAYDPKLHEAPIVVGHPKENGPAYGWIGGLAYNEATGEIDADPAQLDPEFSDMVQAGRFKKRSASWYLPDAPNNPKPGTLYLRHVGFLGAQPPAVKGLRDVSFHDADTGVVEYVDSTRFAWGSVAAMLRSLREWVIGKDGLETADKILPNYYLSDIDAAAKAAVDEPAAMPAYSYSEGSAMTLTPEQLAALQAQVAAQTAEIATLKANQRPADFAERETSLAAREAAVATAQAAAERVTVEGRVQGIVKAGRLLPAQAKQVVSFAMSLAAAEATVDFGEGDKATKVTQRDAYLMQLETAPKVVEFGELSPAGDPPPEGAKSAEAVAMAARKIADKARADGAPISFTEAVSQAQAEFATA